MELIHSFIDTFLHLDQYLADWITQYQNWIYVILFLIIFVETGIVIWPWLPVIHYYLRQELFARSAH